MEEHFVNYNQALALIELGFDEPSIAYFEKMELTHGQLNDIGKKRYLIGPLKSQVFKWFRDNYKIQSLVQEYLLNTYMYTIDDGISSDISIVGFETYEESESACVDKLIEIIKEK